MVKEIQLRRLVKQSGIKIEQKKEKISYEIGKRKKLVMKVAQKEQ